MYATNLFFSISRPCGGRFGRESLVEKVLRATFDRTPMPLAIGDRRQPPRFSGVPGRLISYALIALPTGRRLPDAVWGRRHRALLTLLWLHVPALAAFGVLTGHDLVPTLAEVLLISVFAVVAGLGARSRRFRAVAASLGMLAASASLIHLGGGYIELHFHFFVVVGIVALYQNWTPFLVTISGVVLHHGLMATLAPEAVYNHPEGWAHPWRWAFIHGAFIMAASAASLASWRLNEYHALHDPLTQLPNRTLFLDRLALTATRLARRRDRIAVLYLDVDAFKAVNDRLGHEAGDQALVAVGERLSACVGPSDTAARLGGDEFAVLLDGLATERDAVAVAVRLLRAIRAPIALEGQDLVVTVSVGIALGTSRSVQPTELLRHADAAMYAAKRRGPGRYAMYDPFQAPVLPMERSHSSPIPATQSKVLVAETG